MGTLYPQPPVPHPGALTIAAGRRDAANARGRTEQRGDGSRNGNPVEAPLLRIGTAMVVHFFPLRVA